VSEPTEENLEPEVLEEVETDDESSADVADVDANSDETDDEGEEVTEALDELEAEEREMLTEDESDETIVVDEAAEMRAIRRAEISMDEESADSAHSDEFVCTSCFLVKKTSQMANKRRKICFDCAG
jgi:hypothetical protein